MVQTTRYSRHVLPAAGRLRHRRDLGAAPAVLAAGALVLALWVDSALAAEQRARALSVAETADLDVVVTVQAASAPTFQVFRLPGQPRYAVELPGLVVDGALQATGEKVLLLDAVLEPASKSGPQRLVLSFSADVDFDATARGALLEVRFSHHGDKAALVSAARERKERSGALARAEQAAKETAASDARARAEEASLIAAAKERAEQERLAALDKKRQAQEAALLAAAEARRKTEAEKQAALERKRQEQEAARLAALEAKKRDQEEKKAALEKKRQQEEAARLAALEAKQKEDADKRAALEKKRQQEEAARLAALEAKKKAEQDKQAALEKKRQQEEAARLAAIEAKRKAEDDQKAALEEKRQQEEAARRAALEQKRLDDEAARLAAVELQRREDERKRLAAAEDERRAAEARRLADEARLRAEAAAKADGDREAARRAEEARERAEEEARRQREERARADEQAKQADLVARQQAAERARAEAQARRTDDERARLAGARAPGAEVSSSGATRDSEAAGVGFGGRSIEIGPPVRYQRFQLGERDEFGGGDEDLDEAEGRGVLSKVTVQRTAEGSRVGVRVDGGARYDLRRRGNSQLVLTLFDTRADNLNVRRVLDARALETSVVRVLPSVEEDVRFRVELLIELREQAPVRIGQGDGMLWLEVGSG